MPRSQIAHTLMHELSHLDTFGLKNGWGELTADPVDKWPAIQFHGTDDWGGDSDPFSARELREDTENGEAIPLYRNAESLAALALGMHIR